MVPYAHADICIYRSVCTNHFCNIYHGPTLCIASWRSFSYNLWVICIVREYWGNSHGTWVNPVSSFSRLIYPDSGLPRISPAAVLTRIYMNNRTYHGQISSKNRAIWLRVDFNALRNFRLSEVEVTWTCRKILMRQVEAWLPRVTALWQLPGSHVNCKPW